MCKFKKILIYSMLVLFMAVSVPPTFAAEKINVNTATVEQLTSIKGIGEKTAQKIVKYREDKKFTSLEQLIEVKGIGEKSLAKYKAQLTVGSSSKQ